jgi:hypothetical protein
VPPNVKIKNGSSIFSCFVSGGENGTYTIILASNYKKVFGSEDFDIHKFNKEADKVLEHLKETTPSTRKTKLACLFVLSGNNKYKNLMIHDIGSYNEELSKQEKNDKQKSSWINTDQLTTKYNELKHTADLLYKKQSHTANDLSQIQDYILMCLYSNQFLPPRRLIDYTELKMREINPDTDNYMNKTHSCSINTRRPKCMVGKLWIFPSSCEI